MGNFLFYLHCEIVLDVKMREKEQKSMEKFFVDAEDFEKQCFPMISRLSYIRDWK
jgi:hypothetical protein